MGVPLQSGAWASHCQQDGNKNRAQSWMPEGGKGFCLGTGFFSISSVLPPPTSLPLSPGKDCSSRRWKGGRGSSLILGLGVLRPLLSWAFLGPFPRNVVKTLSVQSQAERSRRLC